jgi:WD40 repeat protein
VPSLSQLQSVPAGGSGLRLVSASLEPANSPFLGARTLHRRLVHSVAVLTDGDTVVTASEDGGRLGVLSLATMEEIGGIDGHSGPVNHLAVDPSTGMLVSAGDDHTVRVWQVSADRGLLETRAVHVLSGHTHFVRQVGVAAGRIVSASQDGTVRVWDLDSGECLHVFTDHTADAMAIAISADGRFAASSSMDNAVLVWDLDAGALAYPLYDTQSELLRFDALGDTYLTLPGPGADRSLHHDCPNWLWLSADGRQLISAQREVIWWELVTGAEITRIPEQGSYLNGAAPHPDGRRIALAGLAGVQVWTRDGDGPPHQLAALIGDHAWSVAYTTDGATLVAGLDSGEVRAWRADIDAAWASRLVHPTTIASITTSPDGRRAASIDYGGTVRLWDLDTGRLVGEGRHGTDFSSEPAAAFLNDSSYLVTASTDFLAVWDVHTGQKWRTIDAPEDTESQLPSALAVLPGDRAVLFGCYGDGLLRWNLSDLSRTVLQGDTSQVVDIQVTADGRWAVTRGNLARPDGTVGCVLQGWDLGTDRLVWTQWAEGSWPSEGGITFGFLRLSPDGRHVVTNSGRTGNTLARWSVETGEPLGELRMPDYIVDTWWDSELVVATMDGGVHWITPDLSALRRSTTVGPSHVLRLVPGGRYAVSRPQHSERDIALVDLDDGSVASRFTADAKVYEFVVAGDGRTVVASDANRAVHILTRD